MACHLHDSLQVATTFVFNARSGSKPKWLEGTIVDHLSPLTYLVSVVGLNRHVHIEHIRRRNMTDTPWQALKALPLSVLNLEPPSTTPEPVSVNEAQLPNSTQVPPDKPTETAPATTAQPAVPNRRNPPRERKAPEGLNL